MDYDEEKDLYDSEKDDSTSEDNDSEIEAINWELEFEEEEIDACTRKISTSSPVESDLNSSNSKRKMLTSSLSKTKSLRVLQSKANYFLFQVIEL